MWWYFGIKKTGSFLLKEGGVVRNALTPMACLLNVCPMERAEYERGS